jgi:hypothetical protein
MLTTPKILNNNYFLRRMNKAYRKYNSDDGRRIGSHPLQFANWGALWLLSFGLLPKIALTQDSSDPMDVCSRMSDSAARLACFDNEVRRRHAAAPAPAPAALVPTPAPPSAAASLTPAPSPAAQPMVVALTRLLPRPGHLFVFELENGQAWESTDSVSDLFLSPHEMVTIRAGVMGAFFLKTQQGISIRIHRLR